MTILARQRVRRAIRVRLIRLSRRIGLRPPAAPRPPWKTVNPVAMADDLSAIVDSPTAAVREWLDRKPAAATYLHPIEPEATRAFRHKTKLLLAGDFRVRANVPPRREHLPPQWEQRPDSGRTEEMYRHSLTWLEAPISVAYVDDDEHLWQVVKEVLASWIVANSKPPGRSRGAWHDHAVAFRARIMCWVLELYRRQPDVDQAFVRLLVASIYQHGLFLADQTTHDARSNHALEAAGSLLAICIGLPQLRTADAWSSLASQRLERYAAQAFGADGFSREQSPAYHFFILRRFASLISYLNAVDHPVPVGLRERLRHATQVWPWLLREDGTLPRIGDSNEGSILYWRRSLSKIGGAPLPPAPSSQPNPRADAAAMLSHPGGVYAVLRGQAPSQILLDATADDTHITFKTDYFSFPHFHRDGLSVVFYALGREWLIDPGPHSYEYGRWERKYLCSSSAHNVVEVDGPFAVHPVEFVAATRTMDGDQVTVRHHLDNAVHTRTVEHRLQRQVRIVDDVVVTDGQRHTVRQLFHVNPECTVEQHGAGTLQVLAPTGERCLITQRHVGTWTIIRGQREPEPLGWHSPRSMVMEPLATCVHQVQTSERVRFETVIQAFPVSVDHHDPQLSATTTRASSPTAVALPT